LQFPTFTEKTGAALQGIGLEVIEKYALLIFSILLLGSILSLIEGIGLLYMKKWARNLGLILAMLSLLDFPFGTTLGVYSIWVLWKKDVKKILSQS